MTFSALSSRQLLAGVVAVGLAGTFLLVGGDRSFAQDSSSVDAWKNLREVQDTPSAPKPAVTSPTTKSVAASSAPKTEAVAQPVPTAPAPKPVAMGQPAATATMPAAIAQPTVTSSSQKPAATVAAVMPTAIEQPTAMPAPIAQPTAGAPAAMPMSVAGSALPRGLPPAVAAASSEEAADSAAARVYTGGPPGEVIFTNEPTVTEHGWTYAAALTGGTRFYTQNCGVDRYLSGSSYYDGSSSNNGDGSSYYANLLASVLDALFGRSNRNDGSSNHHYNDNIKKIGKEVLDSCDEQWFPHIEGQAKMMHTSEDARQRFTFEAYGRWDFQNEYGVVDLPEANFFYDGGTWSILAGMHKEFWGVAESRHLVNIINPIDLDGDPAYEDTFGIPMVNYNVTGNAGTLSLYGIVGFREVNLKGLYDRFPIDEITGSAEFEDGDWRNAAFAARYSNTVNFPGSSLDYALSFFTGTDRYPYLEPNADFNWQQYRGKDPEEIDYKNVDKDLLTPVYYHIDQVGAELLYAIGAWQLKFEGIYRRENNENIWAGVGGFEYTLSNPFGGNFELGLLGEYLYDSQQGGFFQIDYPVSNAVFGGVRLTLNNKYNTNLVAGVSYDIDDESNFIAFSGSSRLTETTQVNLEGRFFQNFPKESGSFLLNYEDYVELSLTKFF